MSPLSVILVIICYFAAIYIISRLSGRGANKTFFAGKKSPWWVVAFAMIGSCMSGVTFVSVPGMVGVSAMGYLQMCLGFMAGYVVIAYVLTPLYFKLGVVSIYEYLEKRFSVSAYKTGAWLFFVSKMLGASVRLFLVCLALQLLVFGPLGLPFALNVVINVAVVLVYTFRNGVSSVIWTDTLKTFCMIVAVVLTLVFVARDLGLSFGGMCSAIGDSGMSRVFFFDDINHPQFFWKQFLGGLFTVIATTGLDQDMMQRTLSCRNVKDSQKNLLVTTVLQTVVIGLFLCLGVLLYMFAARNGIDSSGDKLFPAVATSGLLPGIVGVLFVLGLVSSAYGAGGSALTSLTTSFTLDILGAGTASAGSSASEAGNDSSGATSAEARLARTRKIVHICMAAGMAITIIVFNALNSTSAIDAVYKLASYTYGPLLGMFAFGILTRRTVPGPAGSSRSAGSVPGPAGSSRSASSVPGPAGSSRSASSVPGLAGSSRSVSPVPGPAGRSSRGGLVPIIAILAPAVCLVLQLNAPRWFGGYTFSYEILPLNALLTFLGLLAISRRHPSKS